VEALLERSRWGAGDEWQIVGPPGELVGAVSSWAETSPHGAHGKLGEPAERGDAEVLQRGDEIRRDIGIVNQSRDGERGQELADFPAVEHQRSIWSARPRRFDRNESAGARSDAAACTDRERRPGSS
jgi:hypothetical protein